MDDLIARLKAATEPNAELDRDIAHRFGWWQTPDEKLADARSELGREPSEGLMDWINSVPDRFPPFTASIDTALVLLPEGWRWMRGVLGDVMVAPDTEIFQPRGMSDHPLPAVALCIAILSAVAKDPRLIRKMIPS